ncbi:hypothetical protein HZA73_08180 [candidate division TA06 bacterium]|nr:hypothetical protein [candidate division TA06 bacterium]
MKKMLLSLTLYFAMCSVSYCEQIEARLPKNICAHFFKEVTNKNVSKAYDYLFIASPVVKLKPQDIDVVKRQTEMVAQLYGEINGFDFIREETFGTSIVRLVYILKFEMMATTWEFYFYKPHDEWFLAKIMFNDQFDLLEPKK